MQDWKKDTTVEALGKECENVNRWWGTLEHYNNVECFEIDCSGDFQCDQVSSPVRLCVCWYKGEAWLEPFDFDLDELDKMAIERARPEVFECAGWGIRQCGDTEQFIGLLRELNEAAATPDVYGDVVWRRQKELEYRASRRSCKEPDHDGR